MPFVLGFGGLPYLSYFIKYTPVLIYSLWLSFFFLHNLFNYAGWVQNVWLKKAWVFFMFLVIVFVCGFFFPWILNHWIHKSPELWFCSNCEVGVVYARGKINIYLYNTNPNDQRPGQAVLVFFIDVTYEATFISKQNLCVSREPKLYSFFPEKEWWCLSAFHIPFTEFSHGSFHTLEALSSFDDKRRYNRIFFFFNLTVFSCLNVVSRYTSNEQCSLGWGNRVRMSAYGFLKQSGVQFYY